MASFNETFNFANWDQAKFDAYRNLRDDRADTVAKFILQSPHYSQVYEALGKIVYNNDKVTLQMFEDIIRDRTARASASVNAQTVQAVSQDAQTPGQAIELEQHDSDECLTDADHQELVDTLNEYFNDLSLFDFTNETHPDYKVIDLANDVFNLNNVHCTFALATRSLMKQYAAYNATQVLKFTKLIYDLPYRRILETVQFVMDVMDPNGFAPTGCGIRSIQKLRLVHAMIRVRIDMQLYDQNPVKDQVLLGPFRKEIWGEPINQQDMIFAVHTFSVEVLEALIVIGELHPKKPHEQDSIEAYYKMWHYIGRALGTMDEINPTTYADGKRLQQIIYDKQFSSTESNADLLVPPLVGFLKKLLSTPSDRMIYGLVRFFNQRPEDIKVFKEYLKIDLIKDSSKWFYFVVKLFNYIIGGMAEIIYWLLPEEERVKEAHKLFKANYELLGKVIYVASSGQYATGKHFRIGDGFGLPAPQVDYATYQNQEPFIICFWKMCLKKLWHSLVSFISRPFKKKTSSQAA